MTVKKPTALKKIQGTYRTDRDSNTGVLLPNKMPRCPSFLGDAAKREWKRLAGQLRDVGILKSVDRAALAAFCDSFGRWEELTIELQNEPATFTTKTGYIAPNPKVKQATTAKNDMLKWAAQLGLTPSARGRLVIEAPAKPEDTLAQQLFNLVNED